MNRLTKDFVNLWRGAEKLRRFGGVVLAAAAQSRAHQQAFLREHIGTWVPQLGGRLAARAKTSFYRELARVTRAFLELECFAYMSTHLLKSGEVI